MNLLNIVVSVSVSRPSDDVYMVRQMPWRDNRVGESPTA